MPVKEEQKGRRSTKSESDREEITTFNPTEYFQDLILAFNESIAKTQGLPKAKDLPKAQDLAKDVRDNFHQLHHVLRTRRDSLVQDQKTLNDLWEECKKLAPGVGSDKGKDVVQEDRDQIENFKGDMHRVRNAMDEDLGARKLLQDLVDHGFKDTKDITLVADAFRHAYEPKKDDKGVYIEGIFPKGTSARPVSKRFIAYLKYRKETIEKHSHHSGK